MYGCDRAEPLINDDNTIPPHSICMNQCILFSLLVLMLAFGQPAYATLLSVSIMETPLLSIASNLTITAEAIDFSIYMYSLFCTIASCFICSKLAYLVTYRCLKLEISLNNNNINTPDGLINELMHKEAAFKNNRNVELVRVLVHRSLGPVHHYLLPLHHSLLGNFNDVS